MATNAKNLAELLNTDTTVKVGDIEDGSVTTAKLADGDITTAKLADNAVTGAKLYAENLGRRNLIINGDMRVAQRPSGTSSTGITNNGSHFHMDRWKTVVNSAYTNTVEQSTDVPSGYGFVNSLKQTFTTATSSPSAGDYNVLDQNLEKQNIYSTENGTSSAKSITLSFWVKSSVTGTFAVALQNYGSSRRSNVLSYTISSADTWEKKIITTTADTTANTNSANGSGLGLRFALGSGSNYEASNATTGWQTADYFGFTGATYPAATTNATWQVTGVQLEVGDAATDFEHRSFGEELSLCQRYFCWVSQYFEFSIGTTGSFGSPRQTYATPLRANPTYTVTSSGGAGAVTLNGFSNKNVNGFPIGFGIGFSSTTSGYIYYDTTAKADAEL